MFGLSRYLQQGSLQVYLLYILVIVVGLLLWRPGRLWIAAEQLLHRHPPVPRKVRVNSASVD
ncbi:MAG: hypothetical protein O3A00_25520 [Planctomycetota bacterium]|nr:hypothetical protein [Planctomycetota bacterium]